MYLHPITLIIGAIGTIILLLLTAAGLSCSIYILQPTEYEFLKHFYDLAKIKRIC